MTPLSAALEAIVGRLAAMASTPAPDAETWPTRPEHAHFALSQREASEPWGVEYYTGAAMALACSRCSEGWLPYRDERGYQRLAPCRCHPWREAADLITRAHIPWSLSHATSQSFDWPAGSARAVVTAALQNKDRGLYLFGPTGTGKSHLAAACLRWLALQGVSARFWRWKTVAEAWQAAVYHRNDALTLADLSARLVGAKWLVLDDLMACSSVKLDVQVDILRGILDTAADRRCRLVVTANIPPDEVGDNRVTSRLGALCQAVPILGVDRRLPHDA